MPVRTTPDPGSLPHQAAGTRIRADWPGRKAVRSATADLCAAVVQAEHDCFGRWCKLLDGRGRPSPDDVAASQMVLHEAGESIRAWCLADPEQAEAERLELLRAQAEGEVSTAAALKACRRGAGGRDDIRQAWNSERWRIVSWRDAITTGLGWPHRGEHVIATVSYWRGDPAEEATITGAGIYLHSNDVFNVSHTVWVPQISGDRRRASAPVAWNPPGRSGHLANAGREGDIAIRVAGAESRRLPVPLPRWPRPQDITGGLDPLLNYAIGAQLELF
jgi:hypothetical protein